MNKDIKDNKTPSINEIKEILKNFIYKNRPYSISETVKKSEKNGIAPGDIRIDKFDDLMVYKSTSKLSYNSTEERQSFMREYVSGPLYRRVLYNRAPTISLVLSDNQTQDNTDIIGLRSNYIPNFYTLEDTKEAFQLNADTDLSSVNGFEKVLAACLLFGDSDYHLNNIGVIKQNNGKYIACKIDHGESLKNFFSNESEARLELLHGRKAHGYTYNQVSYDISKLKNAIEEITNISQQEINNIIDSRYRDLIKAGFELSRVPTAEYLKSSIHKNLEAMKELYKSLAIIEMIDGDEKFKYAGWLEEIEDQDPIIWAVANNKTINGQHPYKWALENNKAINGENPFEWVVMNNKDTLKWAVANNKTINGQHIYEWALENNKKILDENPMIWMLKNKKDMIAPKTLENFLIKYSDAELILFIVTEKIKIADQDPILWADNKEISIPVLGKRKVPILTHAIYKGLNIEGMPPLDWCANNRQNTMVNKLTLSEYRNTRDKKIPQKNSLKWKDNKQHVTSPIAEADKTSFSSGNKVRDNNKHTRAYVSSTKNSSGYFR